MPCPHPSSPEPSVLIGASSGTSAWLAMLAPRPLPRSLSPFMVYLRPLFMFMALAFSRQTRGAQTPLNPSLPRPQCSLTWQVFYIDVCQCIAPSPPLLFFSQPVIAAFTTCLLST